MVDLKTGGPLRPAKKPWAIVDSFAEDPRQLMLPAALEQAEQGRNLPPFFRQPYALPPGKRASRLRHRVSQCERYNPFAASGESSKVDYASTLKLPVSFDRNYFGEVDSRPWVMALNPRAVATVYRFARHQDTGAETIDCEPLEGIEDLASEEQYGAPYYAKFIADFAALERGRKLDPAEDCARSLAQQRGNERESNDNNASPKAVAMTQLDVTGTLTAFATIAAVGVSLWLGLRANRQHDSRVYFEQATVAVDRAYKDFLATLDDDGNPPCNGVLWWNAAGTLKYVQTLESLITEPAYKTAFLASKEQWRMQFYRLQKFPAGLPMNCFASHGLENLGSNHTSSIEEKPIAVLYRFAFGQQSSATRVEDEPPIPEDDLRVNEEQVTGALDMARYIREFRALRA